MTEEEKSEPTVLPVGMKVLGTGIIGSCLVLAVLFGWGIYLNLSERPCDCSCPEAGSAVSAGPGTH